MLLRLTILVIALIVVGPRRLPEMGNAVGRTIREFRKASTDITEAASVDASTEASGSPQANTLSGEAKPNTTTSAAGAGDEASAGVSTPAPAVDDDAQAEGPKSDATEQA